MIKKVISLLLVFAIMIQLIPSGVFADDSVAVSAEEKVSEEQYVVLGEVNELRGEYEKHFRLQDGSFTAVAYPLPVHYYENENWQQIDNTLKETEYGYTNAANSFGISLPRVYDTKHGIITENKGYKLSFVLEGANESKGVIDKYKPKYSSEFEKATAVDTSSGITYSGIMPGIDLNYTLESTALYEYLTVYNSKAMPESFSFRIIAEGLEVKQYEDGRISFCAEDDELFCLPNAYMFDSGEGYSESIKTELDAIGSDEYLIRYIPDRSWLNSPDRVWPVTIDPTVLAAFNINNIMDCPVYEGNRDWCYSNHWLMSVGNRDELRTSRTYIRWLNLPTLTSSDVVINAFMSLKVQNASAERPEIRAYAVSGSWLSYQLYWTNQPALDDPNHILDYGVRETEDNSRYRWTLTETVRRWYADRIDGLDYLENYGVALFSNDETANRYVTFYSAENDPASLRPLFYLFYMNTNGLESYWDYTSQNLGRAGTAYVQNYSGNLIVSRTDMSYGGNRMPAEITFNYCFDDRDINLGYGYGWRTNYSHKLDSVNISYTQYYRWKDGDGTTKYFVRDPDTNKWVDEAGQGYELTVHSAVVGGVKFSITDKTDNRLDFNSAGKLIKVADASGNTLNITYLSTDPAAMGISRITDGAGRKYNFNFSNGRLTSIQYTGTGNSAIETITYNIDPSSERLMSVTYSDGKQVAYGYNGRKLAEMLDIVQSSGRRDRLQIDYYTSAVNDALPLRVQSLKYYSQNMLMSSVTLKYGANYTTVTDLAGRSCTYQFNNGGNTTAVYNDEGQALYGKYARDISSSGRANQLVSSSRLQDTVTGQDNAGRTNLLQNADLSDGARCWSLTPVIVSRDTALEPRAKLDSNAIEIVGNSTANCEVYQNYIPSETSSFDQYSFGVWVKSNSVPLTEENRKCGIKVTVYNAGTVVDEEYVPVNADCREWQFISGSIIAEEPYDKIRVSCVYNHNANIAYFDGMQLFKEIFASKCEYDNNGNITKITDISGFVTTYEYINGRSDISKITLPGGSEYWYNYDGNHRVTETVSATGVKTNYSYDAYGNCTETAISAANYGKSITSSTSYTPDGNMTSSVTGGDGNTVSYTNDTQRSLTTGVTDPLGNTTLSTYDSLRRLISSSCGNSQVNYTYSDDLLTQLSHTNTASTETVYTFVDGRGGLMTSVKVGNTTLSTNTYNPNTHTLAQQTFGNGDWWKYSYDRMDTLMERYTNISSTEGVAFEYRYNSKGLLCSIYLYDITLNGTEITSRTLVSSEHYSYDVSDRLVKVEENNELGETVHSYEWQYDSKENITSLTENINGTSYTYSYTYDADSRPAAMNYGSTAEVLTYDALGRTIRSSVRENGHEILRKNYTYKDIDSSRTTTQLFGVSYVYNSTSTDHMYYYDANGNIIMVKPQNDASRIIRYSYDELNELTWEYNPDAGKAWRYNYDFGGNILQKVEYAYVDGVVSGTGTVINYTYGDGNWRDKLTNYNGQSITYDTIGNPTDYRGMDMTWQGGRQLAGVRISDTYTISFEYNEAGLRIKKIVSNGDNDENSHKYYWANGKLSAEICEGSYSLFFHYDANGDILGFSYKDSEATEEYYYVKNLQGDILKVITASGTVVAEYSYNAWGQILTSSGAMADINPIRYRGYYYDIDLALYYLQSRYYDPEVGRFVNTDDVANLGVNSGLTSFNLYTYCGNNPIILIDDCGQIPQAVQDKLVHDMVLQNICGRYSFLSWKYTCVYYNGTNCLGGWGFCDLYNTSTGEVWELKKYSNSRSCTTAAATIQLNRYVNGKLKHNLDLPLTKPYITEITSGNFVFTSGGYRYTVTYWNEGNGILRYSYDVQKTQVRIAAEMVVTVVSLSIALTVAPEIAPIILLA